MRETRAAPVVYAPAGRLRKSTNVVDVPQRAEDFVDPLGLGYVNCSEIVQIPFSSDISCQHLKPKSMSITMWFKDRSYKTGISFRR